MMKDEIVTNQGSNRSQPTGAGVAKHTLQHPMNSPSVKEKQQSLMHLIEIDSDTRQTMSQEEFDKQTNERRTAIEMLLRADDSLLNEVAVAAVAHRRTWTRRHPLMLRIQDWLRE